MNRTSRYIHFFSGKCRAGLLLFFPFFFLISCGLPVSPYLSPPEVYSKNDPENAEQDLVFSNAYDNNASIFLGYEVFYKIYDPLSEDSDASTYSEDITKIKNTAGADFNTFDNLDFNRLFFTETSLLSSQFVHESSKPSLSFSPSLIIDDFKVRFNLNQFGTYYRVEPYEISFPLDFQTIYRWVFSYDISGERVYSAKQFSSESFDINDSDIPESVDSSDLGNSDYYFYITFYITSFGKDPADITKHVYSVPAYLGTLKFYCNLSDNF